MLLASNPPTCNGTWTKYFDLDDSGEKGDFEQLCHLREIFPDQICEHPTLADARIVGTDTHHPIPGQLASLSAHDGFSCKNSHQLFGKCMDYEVRFCCQEGTKNVVCLFAFYCLKYSVLLQDRNREPSLFKAFSNSNELPLCYPNSCR